MTDHRPWCQHTADGHDGAACTASASSATAAAEIRQGPGEHAPTVRLTSSGRAWYMSVASAADVHTVLDELIGRVLLAAVLGDPDAPASGDIERHEFVPVPGRGNRRCADCYQLADHAIHQVTP